MLLPAQQVRTFTEEREAIETRFANWFNTADTPVQYGNMASLKKGLQSIPAPYTGPKWVRLSLQGGTSAQQEVNRNITTMRGLISINIFTLQNLGSNLAREIADEIFPIFNAVAFNGITTGPASVIELPPNNGRYNLTMTIPYTWYRCIIT